MRVALFLAAAPLLFGQLDTNTVSVRASRSIAVQPDQAVFAVSVSAPLDAGFNDVIAALQGTGITAAQFSGLAVSQVTPSIQFRLAWRFVLPVPLAGMKDEVASLTAAQQALVKKQSVFGLSFYVAGTQASPELLAGQSCSKSDLIADATSQARVLSAAGGFSLGPILSMSDVGGVAGAAWVPTASLVSGDFAAGSLASFLLFTPVPLTSPVVSCSLTVKFRVTH